MSALLESLLTPAQRTEAAFADFAAARAAAHKANPASAMGEIARARAGIDHAGRPVEGVGA